MTLNPSPRRVQDFKLWTRSFAYFNVTLSTWRTSDAYGMVPFDGTDSDMKRKHQKTLELIFRRPVSGNVKWVDIKGLLKELGAELEEREGSRVVIFLFGEVRVYHRPHPSPSTDKGAVASVRDWLKANGVTP